MKSWLKPHSKKMDYETRKIIIEQVYQYIPFLGEIIC